MHARLPVPAGYFYCPTLQHDEAENLRLEAIECAMDIVSLSDISLAPQNWRLLVDQNELKVYRGPNSGSTVLCVAFMDIAGSIEEGFGLFQNDSTVKAKEYVERVGRDLDDAALLYSLVEPNTEQPLNKTLVTWLAMKSLIKNIVQQRDFCFLECQREFIHPRYGRRAWIRAMKSIDMACCPDQRDALGLMRGTSPGSGHIFVESDRPGYMHVAYVMQLNLPNNIPQWAGELAMKKRCRTLLDIDRFLREDRLSRTPFVSMSDLQPKDLFGSCFQCCKRFGWLRQKTHCVKCGHVFCRGCIQLWNVKSHGLLAKIWACTRCGLGHRESAPKKSTSTGSVSVASDSSGYSNNSFGCIDPTCQAYEPVRKDSDSMKKKKQGVILYEKNYTASQ